jgi:ABC-2 type transport system permease protein
MLWYKAWLETRNRFLISLGGIVALSSYFVFRQNQKSLNAPAAWYYHTLQNGHEMIGVLWLLAVTLLMMGGLLREKALGTSSFTLALPVSRGHLMLARILCGFVQSLALGIIPWAAMFLVGSLTGLTTSFSQAAFHIVLLIGGGVVFFSLAVLASSVIEGEYTAPAVCLGIAFTDVAAFWDGRFRDFSPWTFITGTQYFNRATGMLSGSIPWLHVAGDFVVASVLAAIAIKVIQKRDF